MSLGFKDSFTRNEYPQQVSSDQDSQERSMIAFSNGASFSALAVERYTTQSNQKRNVSHVTESNSTIPAHTQRPTKPPRYPEYSDYSQRLRSYARWIRRRPDPTCLSESGFFFTNQGDLVRCFQCGIGLKDFSDGDDPLLEHVRYFPECLFLLECLGSQELSTMKAICHEKQPVSTAQSSQQQALAQTNLQCRHPEYQTVEARISSFTGWPSHMIQTPKELAEAGLYYTGVEDHVRCFHCDGGLRRWDPEDVPWTEHCRWFPACPFAREQKGDDFIALVKASAEYSNGENENPSNDQESHGLSNTMEQMTLRDPEFRAALNEHKDTCLEMGFQLTEFNDAVEELRNQGNIKPPLEDVLDMISVIGERKRREKALELVQNETPVEENRRLKSLITCMTCRRNNVNTLFLPCTHHRLCMDCAEPLMDCPVCEKRITQKIRTYLA